MIKLALPILSLLLIACPSKEQPSPPREQVPPQSSPGLAAIRPPAPQGEVITSASNEAVAAFKKGRDLYANFRTAEAIEQLKKAIELDGKFALAHAYLAQATSGEESHRHTEKAAELSQGLPEPEKLQVEILVAQRRGDSERARTLQRKLSEVLPNYARAMLWLGSQSFSDRKWDDAARAFRKVIELDPGEVEAYNSLAYALSYQGKFDEAIEVLRKYVELQPEEGNPQDSLAEVQLMAGRLTEAEATFRKAAESANFWPGWEGVAYARFFQGDFPGGREALDAARKMAPLVTDRLDLDETLAMSLFAEGKTTEALKRLDSVEKEAVEARAESYLVSAPLRRAFILTETGRHAEALKQAALGLTRADAAKLTGAELSSLRRTALTTRLLAETRLRRLADAQKTLEAIEEAAMKDAANVRTQSALHRSRGTLALARGDAAAAVAQLSRCIEDDHLCRYLLAQAQAKTGDKAASEATLAKLRQANRREPMYLYVYVRAKGARAAPR